jgi:hypothetical protein
MRLAWDFFLPKMFLIIFDYIGTLIHAYIRTPDYSLSNLDQPINIKFCSWLSMTCIWQKIVLNGMPMIIFDSIHVHHWLPNFNLLSQSLDSRREFNWLKFGLSFGLKNGLRFHFDSVTCLNMSQAKTQSIFFATFCPIELERELQY